MKIIFITFFSVFLCISCKEKIIDEPVYFEDYYDYRLSTIVDYYNDFCLPSSEGKDIHLQDWMYFLENCSYLSTLTGCLFHYEQTEPPCYCSLESFSQDTSYLKEWFKEHGKKWTIRKADKYVYKKRKGRSVYF